LRFNSSLIIGICSIFLLDQPAHAAASLFIFPTSVIFEVNDHSAEITVANRGDETGTFEIGWVDMAMTPEGGLQKYETQSPWSVQPYVRYSPRRVTLAPSESQVVKIAVRRDETVEEGEYFSHLRVITINSEDPDAADSPSPAPGVAISARAAIAIPVIWRNSRAPSAATIENVTLDHDSNELRVDVRREGLLSVRGFLHVLDADDETKMQPLSDPVPLVIYPNIDARSVSIPLRDGTTIDSLPAGAAVYFTAEDRLDDELTIIANHPLFPPQ